VNSNNILSVGSIQSQVKYQDNDDHLHKGENCHSKNTKEEVYIKHLKPNLKAKIKEELKKHKKGQLILLKENKQTIIDFLIDNKDLIKVEDLKIYEPIYECYREKGNCYICNSLANIICINCHNNSYHNNKEVWLCANHWQKHAREKHKYQIYYL
jgi:hypothetical protein